MFFGPSVTRELAQCLRTLVPHFYDAVTLHGILDLAFAAGLSVMKLRAMRDRAEFCALFSCQQEFIA
jgi:hypothetical protein